MRDVKRGSAFASHHANNETASRWWLAVSRIHIIPREKGDGIDAWPAFGGAENEPEDLFRKLRMR